MATAITYSTTGRKSDLRTVIVDDVHSTLVVLPSGSLDVVTAKLLQGTASRHDWWAEQLGTNPSDFQFICSREQVVAIREIQIAVIVKGRKH